VLAACLTIADQPRMRNAACHAEAATLLCLMSSATAV
jgi:hypothetical protein